MSLCTKCGGEMGTGFEESHREHCAGWTLERLMSTRCHRLDCQNRAEAQITLQTDKETTAYHLCIFHYYQVIAVLRGIQVVTGMVKVGEERVKRG